MKAQMQKGFTLIELMIVVAIIGILAAVAIPQYQNYVGRANFASGLSTVTALKTNVENFILEEGSFPTNDKLTTSDVGISKDANTLGTLSFTPGTAGAGSIGFEFTKGNPGIAEKTITLERDKDGNWTCATTADEKFDRGCTTTPPTN